MKQIFLVLAVLGTLAPMAAFAPWVAQHGLSIPGLVSEMFATDISRFLSMDLICSALAVFAMAARGWKRGVPHAWLAVVGTVSVGVSLGLPLYLYLEARHQEAQRQEAA